MERLANSLQERLPVDVLQAARRLQLCWETTTIALLMYAQQYQEYVKKSKKSTPNNGDPVSSSDHICTCCALLLMACKYSESMRSIRDIFNVVYTTLHDVDIRDLESIYIRHKGSIISKEHLILRMFGFSLEVDIPQKYLLNYCRYLQLCSADTQIAYDIMSAVSLTSMLITVNPNVLACAVLHIAGLFHDVDGKSNSCMRDSIINKDSGEESTACGAALLMSTCRSSDSRAGAGTTTTTSCSSRDIRHTSPEVLCAKLGVCKDETICVVFQILCYLEGRQDEVPSFSTTS